MVYGLNDEGIKIFDEKTKYNILSLGSNSKIEWNFDSLNNRYSGVDLKNLDDEIHTIKIKYDDNSKNIKSKYNENYKLNIKNYITFSQNISELKEQNNALNNINHSIKRLTESIGSK